MADLLPCPFCDGAAHMRTEHDPDDITWHFIQCRSCGARSRGKWHSAGNDCPQLREEVRDEWNTRPAPKEAPSEASRWPNMNQTVAANAFWHPPHPVLKGWIHDCVYSTEQVLLPEGATCTNCGATMIAPATPGTPGGGR